MSYTSRMLSLLGRFRRERNGLAADTMRYDGKRYGLNYGVSLPTVRMVAAEEVVDHNFARYLYGQDVRCLQLAALHLADPLRLSDRDEARFWLEGLRNSELAEEAAFALLRRVEGLEMLRTDTTLESYALLMAAARLAAPATSWIVRSLDLLRRVAADEVAQSYELPLLVQATTVLWARMIGCSDEHRRAVSDALAALGTSSWERQLSDEIGWRFDYQ